MNHFFSRSKDKNLTIPMTFMVLMYWAYAAGNIYFCLMIGIFWIPLWLGLVVKWIFEFRNQPKVSLFKELKNSYLNNMHEFHLFIALCGIICISYEFNDRYFSEMLQMFRFNADLELRLFASRMDGQLALIRFVWMSSLQFLTVVSIVKVMNRLYPTVSREKKPYKLLTHLNAKS